MQQWSIPWVGLVAALALVVTLVLAQLVTRPAPVPQPPRPPMQFGPSGGHPTAYRSGYTLNRMCRTSPSRTTYDLDSVRRRPLERAVSQPPAATRSS